MDINKNQDNSIQRWYDWIRDILYWANNNDKTDVINSVYDALRTSVITIQNESFVTDYTVDKISDLTAQSENLISEKAFIQSMSTPLEDETDTPEDNNNAQDNNAQDSI